MRRLLAGKITARLALIAVVVLLAACSGSASQILAPVGNGPAQAAATDGSAGADRAPTEANGGAVAAPSAAASAAPAASPATGSTGQGAIDTSPQVVYTGSLQLVVADVEQAMAKAKTAVDAAGGFVGASQESNNQDQPTATITYRIPAAKWDDAVTAIRGVATKVVAEQTQASEIGGQIVDLEARIANLRASEAALQKIAEGAGNVNDLLQVQQQLTDVRGQIEELDAQRARLVNQVQYGTLVTTFGLEVAQVKEAAKGWDPATDVDGATATMLSIGQHLVSGGIWFLIVWVPFLLVVLLVLLVAWRIGRRFVRFPAPPTDGGAIGGWTGTETPPQA